MIFGFLKLVRNVSAFFYIFDYSINANMKIKIIKKCNFPIDSVHDLGQKRNERAVAKGLAQWDIEKTQNKNGAPKSTEKK